MTNLVMLLGPGRYRLTRQALESLAANTDPASYNLTLVCDELDFRTEALAIHTIFAISGLTPNVTSLRIENSGHTLSQLKNLGVAWSEQRFGRGDWLYLSDSDVWFSAGWLDKIIMVGEAADHTAFRLFGGQIHPFHGPTHFPVDSAADGRFGWTEHSVLDGPSWLMRWSAWLQYGPLDRTTAPGTCRSEEYPFCRRLLAGGGRIGVTQPHVVVHTGLTTADGHDCVGRKERELMIPEGVLAE